MNETKNWLAQIEYNVFELSKMSVSVFNGLGGVIIGIRAFVAVDSGCALRSGHAKNNKTSICCFSAEHSV